jgi:hypothetical protein
MLSQEGPACSACDDILFCYSINVMLQALICSMQQRKVVRNSNFNALWCCDVALEGAGTHLCLG